MVQLQRDLPGQIYEILKERIINLTMEPGARVNIQALTEEFDVSPTPIKDVLKKLSQEELVVTRSGKGYYVVRLSPQKLNEIYDLRKIFESYALKTAIETIPGEKLQTLREEMENLRGEMNEGEKTIQFYPKDWALHLGIIKNSHNGTLKKFYTQIYDLVRISQHFYRATGQSLEEHIAIVEALLEKNLPRARRALEVHLDHTREKALKALQDSTSLQESDLTHNPIFNRD